MVRADNDMLKTVVRNFMSNAIKFSPEESTIEITMCADGDFAKIDLDEYIMFDTIGPIGDGWYAVMVQFDRDEPLNLCVNEDLYIDPNTAETPEQSAQEEEP